LALQENEALEKLYAQKVNDQEKIDYKYKKAHSEFLEIMRELSRFRGEFLDNYSLRSKLLLTLDVQRKISCMMNTQSEILEGEVTSLKYFFESSQRLFDSKLTNLVNIVKRSPTKKLSFAKSWKISQQHISAIIRQKQNCEIARKMQQKAKLFETEAEESIIEKMRSSPRRKKNSKKFGQLY
jgi:hypothetical protein